MFRGGIFSRKPQCSGAAAAALRTCEGMAAADDRPSELPKIRLGSLEVSRLILGSNPFFGYAHQPGDLGRQMVEYYTDERIIEVLTEAAALGVTAVAAPPQQRWIDLYRRYLDGGGKLTNWIAQPDGDPGQMKEEITRAVRGGAKAVFIQGHRVEDQFAWKRMDVVRGWLEHIKSLGVPAGMASHRPDIHPVAEQEGFPTDFYYQCFFRPDTYRMEERDLAIETIRKIAKPVVGYKILAAGRLPADEAFAFALKHLAAKDGMCVGVFPKVKPGMIEEDVRLARKG